MTNINHLHLFTHDHKHTQKKHKITRHVSHVSVVCFICKSLYMNAWWLCSCNTSQIMQAYHLTKVELQPLRYKLKKRPIATSLFQTSPHSPSVFSMYLRWQGFAVFSKSSALLLFFASCFYGAIYSIFMSVLYKG